MKGEIVITMGAMGREVRNINLMRGKLGKLSADKELLATVAKQKSMLEGETPLISAADKAKEIADSNLDEAAMLLGQKSIEFIAHMVTQSVASMVESSMKQLEDNLAKRIGEQTEIAISQKLTDTMMKLSGNMTHLVDSLVKQQSSNVVNLQDHRKPVQQVVEAEAPVRAPRTAPRRSASSGDTGRVSQSEAVVSILKNCYPSSIDYKELQAQAEALTECSIANISSVLNKLTTSDDPVVIRVSRGSYAYKM